MPRRKARKMVNISTDEVSGVDYPATGLDGWIVMKARDGHEIVTKRDFSDEQRQKLADSGAALPDGGFPIESVGDLKNAIRAIGRASNPTSAKSHIIKRAKALGATDQLPEDWSVSKSDSNSTDDPPLTVSEMLAKAEELANEHITLVHALDNATYLEDAPDSVKKAVDTLTDYLDTEYERDHTDNSSTILDVLKALSSEIAEIKKGTNIGGSTKDQPNSGTDDDEEGDGAGATKDLEDEGESEEEADGDGGTTKDQPNKGTPNKVSTVKKAASDKTTPHTFVDDGDGECKTCGQSMSAGMHKKDMTKDAADSAEDAADSGSDEASEGSTVSPSTVHVFVPLGSNAKCKKCGKPFKEGKHKKAVVVKSASSTSSIGDGYTFSYTSSDGQVWTSTGSAKSDLEVRKEGVVPEIDRDALTDDVRAHVEMLEKSLAEAEEKVAKAAADGDADGSTAEDDEAEMLKSLPEPMRKRFEEMEAIAKSSAEKLEKAQGEADLREAVAKAREWTHLPGLKAEEFAPSLVTLRKSAPEQAAQIEDLFSRASAAVKESALLKEIGSGHFDGGGDAAGKLDAMAKESMSKAATKISYEQAYADVLRTAEGRQLYDEYEKERKESGVR